MGEHNLKGNCWEQAYKCRKDGCCPGEFCDVCHEHCVPRGCCEDCPECEECRHIDKQRQEVDGDWA